MVSIKVRKRYSVGGTAAVERRVTAESIERALALAGPGAGVVFPLDPETFFAPPHAIEGVVEVFPGALAREGAAA